MKNNVEYILKIILNIIVIGLIIFIFAKLFIFLLPIILILIGLYYIYKIFLEKVIKKRKNNFKFNKNNRNLKDNIEEAEIIKEKFDK